MEHLRYQLEVQSSGIFGDQPEYQDCAKVTTQIFDTTLPSELEFDDANSPPNSQILKEGEGTPINPFCIVSEGEQTEESKKPEAKEQAKGTDYHILTQSIVNFTFKKLDKGLILRQTEHPIGSFIPFELKIKTFGVKFYDELSELSKGVPAYKLFWKSVVGYVKTELYIKNGYIYLLQQKKEGFLVHSIWDLQNLFKLFSDRQEHKLRLVFRFQEDNEMKLLTKQLVSDDLNLLANLFGQAENLEILCEN